MRSKHKNALDVARSAWAGDKGNETRVVISGISGFEQIHRAGQIWQKLIQPCKHDVVWRQCGKGTTTGTAACEQHATGLRHESITLGDTRIAGFQHFGIITAIGEKHFAP